MTVFSPSLSLSPPAALTSTSSSSSSFPWKCRGSHPMLGSHLTVAGLGFHCTRPHLSSFLCCADRQPADHSFLSSATQGRSLQPLTLSSLPPLFSSLLMVMDQQKEATASAAGCAACNHMRRKCPPNCIFAPYFPATSPSFDYVHRVYGCSNVGKILESLPVEQRMMAAESLTFEAEARIRDPVLGCVGYIYLLQQHLAQIDRDIQEAEAQIYAAGYQPPPLEQHWYQMPQLTTMTAQPHHEQLDDFLYPTVAAYPSMP